MHTGTQTRIGTILPGLSSITTTPKLSKASKQRLQWIDFYLAHGQNARLACRHFGIAHRTFYRYYQRYKKQGLGGLVDKSHRPTRTRHPTTPRPVIDIVCKLRRENPELSKYKLSVILKREYGHALSPSSVGRIISRYNLFFAPPVKKKNHPGRRGSIARIRKPKDFTPARPGDLIEVDVKHLPHINGRRYAFVAIDVVTRQATVHVGSTISATQGALAWTKAVRALGLPRAVLTDNGSENLGAFAELVQKQELTHYFARPRTPKDKPHVERFIGSLERECIQWGGVVVDQADQQQIIDSWLVKYHSYRPHQALGYLTPNEYKAKLQSNEVALR